MDHRILTDAGLSGDPNCVDLPFNGSGQAGQKLRGFFQISNFSFVSCQVILGLYCVQTVIHLVFRLADQVPKGVGAALANVLVRILCAAHA